MVDLADRVFGIHVTDGRRHFVSDVTESDLKPLSTRNPALSLQHRSHVHIMALAANLFEVKGLVAVVTGAGSGKVCLSSLHYFAYLTICRDRSDDGKGT